MRLNLLLIALIMVAGFGWVLYAPVTQPEIIEIKPPIENLAKEKIPAVEFQTINGKPYTLSAMQEKVVLLNFWASWCAPCIVEMPQLIKLAQDNPDDFNLVLMSVDAKKDAIDMFFRKYKLTLPDNVLVVWDENKKISKDVFGTLRYPESILIDKNGFMTQKVAGAIDWETPDMQATLNDLLQK